MPIYTIHGYRAGREETFEAHVTRVWSTLAALTALSPRVGPWWWRHGDAIEAADDRVGVAGALGTGAVAWWRGGAAATSWCPTFYVGDDDAPWCECSFAVGVALPALPEVFAPERITLRVQLSEHDALARPEAMAALLTTLATTMELLHAHAGGERFPAPRLSLLSDGAPVAGWMTWLGATQAPLPSVLPTPLVARATAQGATLVTAVHEVFRERDATHVAAVGVLDALLARRSAALRS